MNQIFIALAVWAVLITAHAQQQSDTHQQDKQQQQVWPKNDPYFCTDAMLFQRAITNTWVTGNRCYPEKK